MLARERVELVLRDLEEPAASEPRLRPLEDGGEVRCRAASCTSISSPASLQNGNVVEQGRHLNFVRVCIQPNLLSLGKWCMSGRALPSFDCVAAICCGLV